MPFGIQPVHLIVIAVVALLVFGPNKLPEIGRGVGKALLEFRRGMKDMSSGFQEEIEQPVKPVAAIQPPVVYQPVVAQQPVVSPAPIPSQAPVQSVPQIGAVFCSTCGSPNQAGARFCNACGSPLANPVEVRPQLTESQPAAPITAVSIPDEISQDTPGESDITNI